MSKSSWLTCFFCGWWGEHDQDSNFLEADILNLYYNSEEVVIVPLFILRLPGKSKRSPVLLDSCLRRTHPQHKKFSLLRVLISLFLMTSSSLSLQRDLSIFNHTSRCVSSHGDHIFSTAGRKGIIYLHIVASQWRCIHRVNVKLYSPSTLRSLTLADAQSLKMQLGWVWRNRARTASMASRHCTTRPQKLWANNPNVFRLHPCTLSWVTA